MEGTLIKFAPTKQRGFTLIELMIVVVIIGILAAIGYPSYRNYVLRSNRTEGYAALTDAATRQERFFSNNNSYTADMTNLNFDANPYITNQNQFYSVAVDAPTAGCPIASCFSITATAQGRQADDTGCPTLTLNSQGTRTPADCWGN